MSKSHENKVITYLQPREKVIIEAISITTNESKSSIVQTAIKKYIESIPQEQRVILINRLKSK